MGVVQMKKYLGSRTEVFDLLTFNFEFSTDIALLLIKFYISAHNGFMWLNMADKKR
jgi:hypothetical protein